jgi:hypothetical protein
VIEDIFSGRNISTMKLLARFSGVAIELSRRSLGSDPLIVNTTKVRAAFPCGNDKEEAFKYICNRYKLQWNFKKDNDLTDAILLALYQHQVLKS